MHDATISHALGTDYQRSHQTELTKSVRMPMASECLITGRRLFLFTRPDGRFVIEKPDLCCRIFPETAHINQAATFSKKRTLPPSQIAWDQFQRRKLTP
jgi:hypothetical protein